MAKAWDKIKHQIGIGDPSMKMPRSNQPKDKLKSSMEDIRIATSIRVNKYKSNFMEYYYSNDDKLLSYRVAQIHKETSEFFDTHIRSNTLEFICDKISSRIISDTFVEINGDVTSKVILIRYPMNGVTKEISYDINNEDWSNIVKHMYLYKGVTLWGDLEDGDLKFRVIENYKTSLGENWVRYFYFENDTPHFIERMITEEDRVVQRKYKEKKISKDEIEFELVEEVLTELNKLYVFNLSLDERMVNMSTLDLILMYGEQLTTYQKEFKGTAVQIFGDQGLFANDRFQELKSVWKTVSKDQIGDGTAFGDEARPFYEVYSPDIRADQLIAGLENTQQLIANNLKLDKSTIGYIDANETATATLFKGSASVDTINSLKSRFEKIFNEFIQELFDDETIKVVIRPFMLSDSASVASTIKVLSDAGSISTKEKVKLMNPSFDENQIMTEVVRVKLETGIDLLADEEVFAIENNIYINTKGGDGDGRFTDS